MAKYVFKKIKDETNQYDVSDVTFEVDTVGLPELLEEFKNFLLASGFVIRGDLMIEEPDYE